MSRSASKKVAVLIGLTMLVSGAGIVSANADTTAPQVLTFSAFENGPPNNNTLNFLQFNLPGTLTGVTFDLHSTFNFGGLVFVTADVTTGVNGTQQLFHTDIVGPTFNPPPVTLGSNPFFIGGSTFLVNLIIDTGCGSQTGTCEGGWNGTLGVTYTFNPPTDGVPGVPGPIAGAGLPGILFAGGGLLAWWRRKRKDQAAAA